ncbi:flavodoxin FldB [Paraglaciecola sp.]|uniref:flavodoxin FldB n=1 Tax=Pseudomonadati TaxID=3379134 RepID=UPI00273EC439|nr:flavodoxin FldB [Paraglaciecola sp.]MDP5031551.1 flavodoxin FldB [Paraglaciecola sp.]
MTTATNDIGLFYGSSTCYTEMAAEKIQAKLNDLLAPRHIQLFNIKDVALKQAEQFTTLIFGISTWDFGELQEDWESSWDDIAELNLQDKTVALFGLGDQLGYADWFQDALGLLHDELAILGCQFIGYWFNEGYEFNESKALIADDEYFVGLCLDDENQYELSDSRIDQWCQQLVAELAEI